MRFLRWAHRRGTSCLRSTVETVIRTAADLLLPRRRRCLPSQPQAQPRRIRTTVFLQPTLTSKPPCSSSNQHPHPHLEPILSLVEPQDRRALRLPRACPREVPSPAVRSPQAHSPLGRSRCSWKAEVPASLVVDRDMTLDWVLRVPRRWVGSKGSSGLRGERAFSLATGS